MNAISFSTLFPGAKRAQCNGCGVCMLSCPIWMQHRTPTLTSCGRTLAVQDGAQGSELAASARACILCGSCEALCPRELRTVQATLRLRKLLQKTGTVPMSSATRGSSKRPTSASGRLLLAGQSLRENTALLGTVLGLLGHSTVLVDDDGQDIISAMESGAEISDNRIAGFLSSLAGASEIVLADGLLFALLLPLLPRPTRFRSLGELLLANPDVRAGLRPTDLYIIEARAYNLRWNEMVKYYDKLRNEIGCSMNLDLHRVATPTGNMGMRYRGSFPQLVSPAAQVAWLLEGRQVDRIVVEHPDDFAVFEQHSSLPIVHLAEVIRS